MEADVSKMEITETDPGKIQSRAADAILENGVSFDVTVDRLRWYHKLFRLKGRRTFTIYPIKLGALLEIAKVINVIKLDIKAGESIIEKSVENILRNKDALVDVAVMAIINSKGHPIRRYFLRRYINNNLNAHELMKIFELITVQMKVSDFLASILSVKGMSVMRTPTGKDGVTEGNGSTSGKPSEAS